MRSLPYVPEGTEYPYEGNELIKPMEINWDGVELRNIRLSVTPIDEFGLPVNRRGMLVEYPDASVSDIDKRRLARAAGLQVEMTLLDIFGLINKEKNG